MKITTLIWLLLCGLGFGALPGAYAQFAETAGPVMAQAATPDRPVEKRAVVDDREIALRVQSALYKDKRVSGLGLAVRANDGTVELSGRADSQSQADRAVQIARSVPGVKAVSSEIRIN